jgi:hypothetical protein
MLETPFPSLVRFHVAAKNHKRSFYMGATPWTNACTGGAILGKGARRLAGKVRIRPSTDRQRGTEPLASKYIVSDVARVT